MKVISQDRLKRIKDMFEALDKIPHEQRKNWFYGSNFTSYDWAIETLDTLIKRMQTNSDRAK
jgi:hypothetical protein